MTDSDLRVSIDRMPSPEELGVLLSGDPIDALVGLTRDRALVDVSIELQARADADEAAVRAALQTAQAAAQLVAEHGDAAALTEEQRNALELFILLSSRPSFFVSGGTVTDRPANWPQFGRDSRMIEQQIAGVGRIEAAPGGAELTSGTGFLVGDRRVMTNNHVVAGLCGGALEWWNDKPEWYAEAVEQANADWAADPDQGPLFNLLGEVNSGATNMTRVTGVVAHHPDVDLAILEIAEVPDGGRTLTVADRQPDGIVGREIYVLGYPVAAGLEAEPVIDRIFGGADALRTKRCSPGKIIGREGRELRHDASTLGGSSGSAVIDFEMDAVIALHFAGAARKFNLAVPLWSLRDDPLLLDNGVVFG